MNKNLHNMDDIFKDAYKEFGEDPSPDVWEKINAGLDKKDAVSYKIISRNWKRIAIILILIVSGFIIYEAGIVKTSSPHSKQNTPTATEQKGLNNDIVTQDETTKSNQSLQEKTGAEKSKPLIKKNNDNIEISREMMTSGNKNITSGFRQKKEKNIYTLSNKKPKTVEESNQDETAVAAPSSVESKNNLLTSQKDVFREKIVIPLFEKVHAKEMLAGLSSMHQVHLGILNNSIDVNKKQMWNNKFKSYWTITGFTSYDWANYRLENDFQTVERIKQQETHEPSLSTGILLTRQLTNKLGILSGLIYSKTSIGIDPQKIYASNDPAGNISYKYVSSSGYGYVKPNFGAPPAVGDSLNAAEAKHTVAQVSMPLEVKYTIRKNKFSFIPGIGIAANFLTGEKITTEVEDASHKEMVSINKLNGTRSLNLSFVADAEMQYRLADRVSINFRPAFRYALSPITKGNVVETYPYNFGAGLGVTYRF